MKKQSLFFLLILLVTFSCNKEETLDLPEEGIHSQSTQSLGHPDCAIIDFEALKEGLAVERQQWHVPPMGSWWSTCEAMDLDFLVDPCFLPPNDVSYLNAITSAVAAYNAVAGCSVNITLHGIFGPPPPGTNIDVTIQCSNTLFETLLALGAVNAIGGNTIGIDVDSDELINRTLEDCVVDACFRRNTVMHEIGHILGYGHSNGSEGELIAGTTNTTNSVMATGDCNADICAFSTGDIIALTSKYPDPCSNNPRVALSIDVSNPTKGQTIAITSTPDIVNDYDVIVTYPDGIYSGSTLIHTQCGNASITTNYTIPNFVGQGCLMKISIQQCGGTGTTLEFDLENPATAILEMGVSDQDGCYNNYFQPGELIRVNTTANGGAYKVYATYECYGTVNYLPILETDCDEATATGTFTLPSFSCLLNSPWNDFKVIAATLNGVVLFEQEYNIYGPICN